MTRRLLPAVVLGLCAVTAITAATARADGFYYTESFGGTRVHDELSAYLPSAVRAQIAIGMRRGAWAVEGFFSADLDSRVDYYPEPKGSSSLTAVGVAVKRIFPLSRHFDVYLRGDASYGYGDQSLAGFSGRGLGAGAGVQLKGRGSVLGLLFWPLFFTDIGPKMTAALYLDDGYDFYRLHDGGDLRATPAVDGQLSHLSLGIAVGTDF